MQKVYYGKKNMYQKNIIKTSHKSFFYIYNYKKNDTHTKRRESPFVLVFFFASAFDKSIIKEEPRDRFFFFFEFTMTSKNKAVSNSNADDLLDMNYIVKSMGLKTSGTSLRLSYAVSSSNTSSGYNGLSGVFGIPMVNSDRTEDASTRLVAKEIYADMDPVSTLTPLDEGEVAACIDIAANYGVVNLCSREFEDTLFEVPFQIGIHSDSGEEMATLEDSVREIIVNNFWMPFLKKHYQWKKTFGIVPIFFEPVGLMETSNNKEEGKNSKLVVYYVPTTPNFDAGRIFLYLNTKGKLGYVWKWNSSCMNQTIDIMLPISGVSSLSNFTVFGLGGLMNNIADISGSKKNKRGMLSVLRSRYFYMDVIKEPFSNGYLNSDIKSLINDWKSLRCMEDLRYFAACRQTNPEVLVEFAPDPIAATSGDSMDAAKLQLDIMRLSSMGSSGNNGRNFSSEFGQTVGDDARDFANSIVNDPNYSKSAYQKVNEARDKVLNSYPSFADVDLGLLDPNEIGNRGRLGFGASKAGNNGLEKLLLYATNHPGTRESDAITSVIMGKGTGVPPSNVRNLRAYEKVVSGPKIEMPAFDVESKWARMDKMASAVCDYPLELIMDKTGRSTEVDKDTTFRFLRDKLASESKTYEKLIKNLWLMCHLEFQKNTKRKAKRINKILDELEKIDLDTIELFENARVSFPRTPFETIDTFLEFFKMGLITEVQFQKFIADKSGIPEVSPERMKEYRKKLDEYAFPPEEDPDKENIASPSKKKRKNESSSKEPKKKKAKNIP
jgi:hypothetical protein